MNLQQHYDLIGQVLKERPELGSCSLSLIDGHCWQQFNLVHNTTLNSLALQKPSIELTKFQELVCQTINQ